MKPYALPCVWVHLHGLTFRWGRPDDCVTVLRGDHCGRETDKDIVATFSVQGPWLNQNEAEEVARKWLRVHPDKAPHGRRLSAS